MSKPVSVTIGITAYNEAANIASLLRDLTSQIPGNYVLERIIVISDGSTDATVKQALSLNHPLIHVIPGKTRLGQALRQNQVFSLATSDYVILLDADIIAPADLLLHLISGTVSQQADLAGVRVDPLPESDLLPRVLNWHMGWKTGLFTRINNGDNIYLCHGRARAFSRRAYTQIRWPRVWSEDAFGYLKARQLGLKFAYIPQAKIFYKSPTTWSDHSRQSVRFLTGRRALAQHFPKAFVRHHYHIPRFLFLSHALWGFLRAPFLATAYLTFFVRAWWQAKFVRSTDPQDGLWSVSLSTKNLIRR